MNANVPCFIFSFQADRPISFVNELMMKALGYELDEIVGEMRFEDFLTGGSRILYTTHFYPILLLENEIIEIFMSLRSKSGEEFPVLINMSIMPTEGIQVVTGAAFKISKRNNYEKRILEAKHDAEKALQENVLLEQTQKELEASRTLLEDQLGRMAGINKNQNAFNKILAHDLQEPIRKIQIFASRMENLTNEENVNDKCRTYVERVKRIAERSHKLLKRLHALHSLEYKEHNYTTVDLETIVENALVKIGKLPISITYAQMDISNIFGDPPQLIMLFSELLKNAYQHKASDKQPIVTISTSKITDNYHQALVGVYRYVDYMRLKITDNSEGFSSYTVDDLYKPFQTSNNDTGKGLGLAFCKKIVDLHKGRISIQALPTGGSEIVIHLPINPFDNKGKRL